MPRSLCNNCRYPQNVCICPWLCRIDCAAHITILQHHRESLHAKNTARLVQLAIPDADVRVVQANTDLTRAIGIQDDAPYAVFFPTRDSRPFEKNLSSFSANTYRHILFLDGSWKQASGMAQHLSGNPDLHFFHFDNPPPSRYQIRHTPQPCALSTIEAVALVLQKAFSVDTQPLSELLHGFQSLWRGPVSHRRKHRR
jgi:DTW domain-containing protein YfiP